MRVEIDSETVARNVRTLDRMVDRLDELVAQTRAVAADQSAATWSTLPAAERFATTYGEGVDTLADRVAAARTAAVDARSALTGSVRALVGIDETIFAELQRLAAGTSGSSVRDTRPVLRVYPGAATASVGGLS
ncbi:MAG: hypothetical protein NVV70_08950 [Cellulomonas sp.]|uniref:hypothetical protein n=1 Tax=Cellulomonas sp. A375-1 TaxID=1672219 RepID=UPI000B1ADE4D|nr:MULTISPECIES: hypothetical protein [unclassified Cellulomonas]MCR6648244.1 hypothetical protein [Cellulomonas sp.]